MLDTIKSERLSQMILQIVEDNPSVSIIAVTRHFSLLNQSLLEIGFFDNLVEMKPPTKDQRYELIKELAPDTLKKKEVKLQSMSHLTEYFFAKDLY